MPLGSPRRFPPRSPHLWDLQCHYGGNYGVSPSKWYIRGVRSRSKWIAIFKAMSYPSSCSSPEPLEVTQLEAPVLSDSQLRKGWEMLEHLGVDVSARLWE